jgi:outer membrane protein OmpA-like peptidoglycan-associated protein
MSKGIDVGAETVKAASGRVALILVSDFWQIDAGAVNAVLDKLKADYGGRLCIYTIKVGNARQTDDLTAAYVTDVLLQPAAVPAAAVRYEKNTVSATAVFDHGKAALKKEGRTALHALDQSIKARGVNVVDIRVIGYTDSEGTEKYNMALSIRRAEAVKEYMVSDGVAPSIMKVSGEGEANPVASNATAEGRAQNRRVDIYVGRRE